MIPAALAIGLATGVAIRHRYPTAGECIMALCGGVLAGYAVLWGFS